MMKLLAPFALAALAMTAACTDGTVVSGTWRDGQSVAGACHEFFFDTDAHVEIFDGQGVVVASESFDCDELGFSLEIPTDVTHVRVTATDPEGSHWEKAFDIQDGALDVGTIWFTQDIQPD